MLLERKEERERGGEMNICNVKNRKIPMYMYIHLQEAILYYICVKPYDVVECVCMCTLSLKTSAKSSILFQYHWLGLKTVALAERIFP